MSNPFQVPIKKPSNPPTPGDDLLCPVCGKDQRSPYQWQRCFACDDQLTGWNDAPIEVMKAWTGVGGWPSPVAGRA